MLRIHRCDHLAAAFTAPEYKSAIARVLSNHRGAVRMHIANDQKLGRFNVSLPLCVLCSNNVLLLLPTYTNASRRKQWRHHCNTLLDGQLVCMCFGERPSAFLIPALSSREMFAMQIECMLSAKAHIHVDAFTAAGMFLSCCKIISSIPVLILARVHFTMQIETATTT
jgi:hypothetical protein